MKLIIGSILIFSLIIFFLFALFPSEISVSRLIQVNGSSRQLNKKITDLREWSSWNTLSSNAVENLKSNKSAVRVDSVLIKKGNFSIVMVRSVQDTVITKWQQDGRSFVSSYVLTKSSNGEILEWTLRFHVRWYPWEKLGSMFYDKQLGPVMESSLLRLNKELQATSE